MPVAFDSEVSADAPAKIEFEFSAVIIDERQAQMLIFCDAEIPSAARFCDAFDVTPAAHGFFVADADDIMAEIVAWVAQVPQECAHPSIWSIPIGRGRFVGITKPPHRVEFVASGDLRFCGWQHAHAVPLPFERIRLEERLRVGLFFWHYGILLRVN